MSQLCKAQERCPGYREPGYGLIRSTLLVLKETDDQSQRPHSYGSLPADAQYRAGSSSSESEDSDSAESDLLLHFTTRPPLRLARLAYLSSDLTEQSVCYSLTQLDVNSRVLYGNYVLPTGNAVRSRTAFIPLLRHAVSGCCQHFQPLTNRCICATWSSSNMLEPYHK